MSVNKTTQTNNMEEFADVFTGIGLVPGEGLVQYLHRPGATPVVHPTRQIPHALCDSLREELQNM